VSDNLELQPSHIVAENIKFVFDKMVELEISESVADFIEGHVPKRIGAKHYMVLRRQADKFYGKYAEYLKKLRVKVPKNVPDKKASQPDTVQNQF